MPKFFFHIHDENGFSRDREGQQLPDLEAARREAFNASREILGEKLLHGGSLNCRTIEIVDEAGHVLDKVNARDVLFEDGNLRAYPDDVTQSAPVNRPAK